MGSPVVTDLWVDPVNGADANNGLTRTTALKSLSAAFSRVPAGAPFTGTGWRLNLLPGAYSALYAGDRHGTFQYPLILQAVNGPGTVTMNGSLSVDTCSYVYLIDLKISPPATATVHHGLHISASDHILVRGVTVVGIGSLSGKTTVKEGLKANQSQYLYVENCDLSNAWDNALDFVAVQYGHVLFNKVHTASSWAGYVKGGSAELNIEGNEFYDSPVGGFIVGGSTGFEFVVSPWLHYEAYNVKFVNNVIHDTGGAAMGTAGAYNALLAYNSLYRVSTAAPPIRVAQGERTCDGDTTTCEQNRLAGGWGTASLTAGHPIPNKNVFIYNNLIYNPPGYTPGNRQFQVLGPAVPDPTSNIPSPAVTDDNLQIRGNVIWNGTSTTPLGIELTSYGCQPSNPTCNATQLKADNTINQREPDAAWDATAASLTPPYGSWLPTALVFVIPDFLGGDLPTPPLTVQGNLSNTVPYDRPGSSRTSTAPPGAYLGSQTTPPSGVKLDQTAISFNFTIGQTVPAARTINATSGGIPVSIKAASSAAWLLVTPATGSTPAALSVSVSTTGLTAGTYQGVITVTGGSSSATLNVSLTVTSPAATFSASPSALYLSYTVGGAIPAPTQVRIVSTPAGVGFTASPGAAWLQVTPTTATATAYLSVSIAPAGLTAGTYLTNLTVTGNGGGTLQIPVSLKVNPQADITLKPKSMAFSYASGGTIPAGQALTVSSTAAAFNWTGSSNAAWLLLSSAAGASGATTTVSVDPTGLAAGTYNGAVTITAPGTASGSVALPVTLTVTSASSGATTYYASPSALYLSYTVGGSAPAPAPVRITAAKTGAAFTVSTTAAWLQATPGSAQTTAYLSVTTTPGQLAPGNYTASVVVTGTGGGSVVIPVSLKVSAQPSISMSPKSLAFSAAQGTVPASKTLGIGTTSVAYAYTLSVNAPWLKLSAVSGTAWGSSIVSVDTTGLAPGTYTGAVTVTAPATVNGSVVVPVTLTITP
ncbi:MAG: hypothetical protein QM757_28765 [Paludibaculum sp.]